MQINWSLLGSPPNIGEAFQGGFATAQRSALASQALTERRDEMQRQSALRHGLTAAYDPRSGTLDPMRARAAYLGAGDIEGVMEFDQSQRQQQTEINQQQQRAIVIGAQLIRRVNPTDQAGWDRVRTLAPQLGVPLDQVPEAFDPQYTQNVLAAADAISAHTGEAYTLNPGDIRFDAGGRELARGAPRPQAPIPVPAGGGVYIPNDTGGGNFTPMGGAPQETIAENPQTGERVRLNPETGQWEPMGGASSSNGSGGFPG